MRTPGGGSQCGADFQSGPFSKPGSLPLWAVFHSVILKFCFHEPQGTISIARRTLADVWVGRLHPALDRYFSDSAGPRAGRPAGFRREIAVAAHPAAPRAIHARDLDRPGLLG